MSLKSVTTPILLGAIALLSACGTGGSGSEKVIKSAKAGEMTVTISSPAGELKNGENDLIVTFADAASNPVDVGAVSLNFHMAAMGAMAEMNDKATLTTTETPGKYRAQVNLEVGGTWEAQVKYQGAHGAGQTTMTVQAK
jgi:ABC-type uncharacterized transport system YnjBCD substrate-binding protein